MKLPKKNEIRKPSKTLAGVTPLAVMLKPKRCKHGLCVYCPKYDVPQSYTPLSPPVIRAKMLNYSPEKQVKARLKAFELMNHPTDKIELIVMGGTFLEYPKKYQKEFIKRCYDALNGSKAKNLEEAKKKNETSKHRCVALCLETRPDTCNKETVKWMVKLGTTRVEIGVQAIDDKIYKKVNRGHKVKDVVKATKILKNAGFKVGYHIMPGIPGSNPEKDLEMFKKIFKDEKFKPDQLKIYPCQVFKNSVLEKWVEQGRYKPYKKKEIESLLIKMLKIVPEYCRVMRIMREIPPKYLASGTERIDLRSEVEKKLRRDKIKLNEIRYREVGFNLRDKKIKKKLKLKVKKYKSSDGKEYFLQMVNKNNILFGLLRLRLPDRTFIKELKKSAIIRELHIYGKAEKIGKKGRIQHTGLGKKLMKKAEEIVKETSKKKIAVISGTGVREYYRKLDYKLEKNYMIKKIKN